MTPTPPRLLRPLLPLALLAALPGCPRNTARPSEPAVDRGDGTLPTLAAPHLARGAITVDGRMNEPAWQRAGSTGPLVNPGNGHPEPDSRVNATARIAWDDDAIYFGFVVYDRDPTTPFHAGEVDPHLWERASAVELMIQPGDPGDNSDYYEVQVDTAGAVWDTHFDNYNAPRGPGPDGAMRFGHQEWSSALRQASVVDRAGGRYTLEIAVPWTSLPSARVASPPRPGDVWRVNVYSFRDGQRDSLAWSPLLGQGNFHRASRFGRVTFAP